MECFGQVESSIQCFFLRQLYVRRRIENPGSGVVRFFTLREEELEDGQRLIGELARRQRPGVNAVFEGHLSSRSRLLSSVVRVVGLCFFSVVVGDEVRLSIGRETVKNLPPFSLFLVSPLPPFPTLNRTPSSLLSFNFFTSPHRRKCSNIS